MSDWAEIASFERDPHGGFIRRNVGEWREIFDGWEIGPATILVSSDGMDEMIAQARVMEDCADALEAIKPRLGRCEHGVDLTQEIETGEMKWGVNAYYAFARFARPTELALILYGWHDDMDVFCVPLAFNPAGVLYQC